MYPHSFIANLKDIKHFFGCGYRQVEGIVRALSKRIKELRGRIPDYTTVWERAVNIPPSIDKTTLMA